MKAFFEVNCKFSDFFLIYASFNVFLAVNTLLISPYFF